jgi:hypothetical protein
MSDWKLAWVQFMTSGEMNSTVPQIEIGIESDLTRLKSLASCSGYKTFFSGTNKESSGLYYKHITIVNDAARVIRITIVSDATTWSITYDRN